MIGVGKAFASPPSAPCWRFSRTRLSSRWFPHRGCLARYQTVDCVNSKKLREGGYSPPLTPLPAPTPCVSSAKRLRLAIVQAWLAHRLASLPRMALRHCRNYLASCQTSRIQLPTFLPIGAVLLAAPLTAQKRHRCYEGSDSRRSHTRTAGLSAYSALSSEHPTPNHVMGPSIVFAVVSTHSAGLATQASP